MEEGSLTCPICYEGYDLANRRPKILGCKHTFCLQCLSQHSAANGQFCPFDRRVFVTAPLQLQDNRDLCAQLENRRGRASARQGPCGTSTENTENIKSLYVGNLPDLPRYFAPDALKEDIHIVFSPYGRVSDIHILQKREGAAGQRSTFAFVTFEDEAATDRVLNNRPICLGDSKLNVQLKRPGGPRQYGQRTGSEQDYDSNVLHQVFVASLPLFVTETELRTLFSGYGAVDSVTIRQKRDNGRTRAFAFVSFVESRAVENVLRRKPIKYFGANALNGVDLKVREYQARQRATPAPYAPSRAALQVPERMAVPQISLPVRDSQVRQRATPDPYAPSRAALQVPERMAVPQIRLPVRDSQVRQRATPASRATLRVTSHVPARESQECCIL